MRESIRPVNEAFTLLALMGSAASVPFKMSGLLWLSFLTGFEIAALAVTPSYSTSHSHCL